MLLANELKKGVSFPKARENALMLYFGDIRKYLNVLSSPNNILGLEYMKSLKKYNSIIKPVAITRFEAGYNDISYSGNIASATAIRNIIKNGNFKVLRKLVPAPSYEILMDNIKQGEIIYNLRKMSLSEIAELPDVSEGLENSIKKVANSCNTVNEFLNLIKSKRYTSTRIQRILIYSLLGITKKDMALSKKVNPYIRVLGFNKRGKFLISEIAKANPKLDIITSVKRFIDTSSNKNLKSVLEKDIWATNVYSIGYDFDSCNNLDFTKKIITI